MKKHLILIFLGLFILRAHGQGIVFAKNQTWNKVKEQASKQQKFIFIDAYTTWCKPCWEMSSEVFPDIELGNFINDKFISVKVQMDRTINDNDFVKSWYTDAKEFERKYAISAFPSIIILDTEGSLISKIVGYRKSKELITETTEAIAQYEEFNKQYRDFKGGNMDTLFLKALVKFGQKIGQLDKSHEVAQAFINHLSDQELLSKDNLLFAYRNTIKSTDKLFRLCKDKPEEIDQLLQIEGAAKARINRVITLEFIEPNMSDPNADWISIKNRVHAKYGKLLDEQYYYGMRLLHSLTHERWSEFGRFYGLYFRNTSNPLVLHINNMSWNVVEHVDDRKVINVAIEIMAYNNEKFDKNSHLSMDTYANLLYKAGRKSEAIIAQQKAIELSKNEKQFVETLEKMKSGEKLW